MIDRSEVVIIGGGPAGATAASLLAQAGKEVAVFEKSHFPRFHIGESLVPAVNIILERLGLLETVQGMGFPVKNGVQFFSPKGAGRPFYFSETDDPRTHSTWQVERSSFDQALLDHARESGAKIFEDTRVLEPLVEDGVVTGVMVETEGAGEEPVRARMVLDASGQDGMLARPFGGREHVIGLEHISIFAHFENARLDPGIDAGSTLIMRLDGKPWLWFIPLPGAVSVGLVTPVKELPNFGANPQEILENAIAQCPPMAERLQGAKQTTAARAARDFSYRSKRDAGPGWALIGDSLGFIDPMYSTGLLLSLTSAELAADATIKALDEDVPDLTGYSGPYQDAFDQFLYLVEAFYDEEFHFSALAADPVLRKGLVDLLTGIVGTPQARAVNKHIRDEFEQRRRQQTVTRP